MRGPRVGPRRRRKRVRGVQVQGRTALGPRPLSARPPRAAREVREKTDTAKPSLCLAGATPPQGDAQRDAEKPERGDDARRDVGVPRVCRRVSAVRPRARPRSTASPPARPHPNVLPGRPRRPRSAGVTGDARTPRGPPAEGRSRLCKGAIRSFPAHGALAVTAEPLPSRPAESDVPVFEHGTVGEDHEAGTAGTRGVPDARGTPATSRRTQLGGFPPSFPEVASRAWPYLRIGPQLQGQRSLVWDETT